MEELKAMFRVCAYIKKDGDRCNSPALKGMNFCYHHIGGSLRELTRARSTYNGAKLDFLYPGHRQAIQHNLFVVAQALNDGKLDLSMANTYNRIFATCERNLRRFEALCQTPGAEKELSPVPDDAPEPVDSTPPPTDVGGPLKPAVGLSGEPKPASPDGGAGAPEPALNEVKGPASGTWVNSTPATPMSPPTDVILSEATVGSKVEEPAFSRPSPSSSQISDAPSVCSASFVVNSSKDSPDSGERVKTAIEERWQAEKTGHALR